MVRAMYATLIMYYNERFRAKEMVFVQERLRDSYEAKLSKEDDTHKVLVGWGVLVKNQFTTDNLQLTERKMHSNGEQIVHAVQGVAATVAGVQDQVRNPPPL